MPDAAKKSSGLAQAISGQAVGAFFAVLSGLVVLYVTNILQGQSTSLLTGIVYQQVNGKVVPAENFKVRIADQAHYYVKNDFEENTSSTGYFSGTIEGSGKHSIKIKIFSPNGDSVVKDVVVDFGRDSNEIERVEMQVSAVDEQVQKRSKKQAVPLHIQPGASSSGDSRNEILDSRSPVTTKSDPDTKVKFTSDIAVMAMQEGKFNGALSSSFASWIQQANPSKTVIKNKLLDESVILAIIEGNSRLIVSSQTNLGSKYICLANYTTEYSSSSVNESLVVARISMAVTIAETASGKILESFEHTEKSSGVSKEMALQRVQDDVFAYLKTKTISLQ